VLRSMEGVAPDNNIPTNHITTNLPLCACEDTVAFTYSLSIASDRVPVPTCQCNLVLETT